MLSALPFIEQPEDVIGPADTTHDPLLNPCAWENKARVIPRGPIRSLLRARYIVGTTPLFPVGFPASTCSHNSWYMYDEQSRILMLEASMADGRVSWSWIDWGITFFHTILCLTVLGHETFDALSVASLLNYLLKVLPPTRRTRAFGSSTNEGTDTWVKWQILPEPDGEWNHTFKYDLM